MQTRLSSFSRNAKGTKKDSQWIRLQDGLFVCKWRQAEEYLEDLVRIAAFDLDHTLIRPKSNGRFSLHENDWQLVFEAIPSLIEALKSKGHLIVIISNQNGINLDMSGRILFQFQVKVESLLRKLNVPCLVLAASKKNKYRKPCIGMWDYMQNEYLTDKTIDLANSFYVGDAAGRLKGWSADKQPDFACSDRKFALNVGVQFYTPEEYFLSWPKCQLYDLGKFSPISLKTKAYHIGRFSLACLDEQSTGVRDKILFIFVGPPTSGKTAFFDAKLSPHCVARIANEGLSKKSLTTAVEDQRSIAIDLRNPSKACRKRFIGLGKEKGYKIKCLHFAHDQELVQHLNVYNSVVNNVAPVPDIEYFQYYREFDEPQCEEGFEEIIKIPFLLDDANDNVGKYMFLYLS